MQPEDTEKADNTQRREQLHQMGIEHLLLARRDPHHDPQGECIDHGYQRHDQEARHTAWRSGDAAAMARDFLQ